MPTRINGLPAHVLLIHVIIALLPLSAVLLVASAAWPAARARIGVFGPLVALITALAVPVTINAGHWLQRHLGYSNAAIRKHAGLGEQLLPWAAGVFVLSVVVWHMGRRYELAWRPSPFPPADSASLDFLPTTGGGATATLVRTQTMASKRALSVWVTALLTLLALAVSVGAMVQLYRIGDSGAQAVWHGVARG